MPLLPHLLYAPSWLGCRVYDSTSGSGHVTPRRLTLNDVADQYFDEFESKVSRGERSERTLQVNRQRFDTHVRRSLGRRQIQSLRVADVTRVVGSVFEFAIRQEFVATNPVSSLRGEKPPAKNRTKARILEAEEVANLIGHAPKGYRTLIVTAVYTGLRQSELLGLRWSDVDFDAGTLNVRHQLSRATRKQPARLVPLKTDAAERVIDLAPELVRELAKHNLASRFSSDEDFVFATETGNPVYYRNASCRGLDKAADRAGLNPEDVQRLSFHDLRHTAITHLIRSGADAAQVSRFAGHSRTRSKVAGSFTWNGGVGTSVTLSFDVICNPGT